MTNKTKKTGCLVQDPELDTERARLRGLLANGGVGALVKAMAEPNQPINSRGGPGGYSSRSGYRVAVASPAAAHAPLTRSDFDAMRAELVARASALFPETAELV